MARSSLRNVCFVIGPIGDEHAPPESAARATYERSIEVVTQVIEPACAFHRLDVLRADRIARPGEIPEQIFRLLRDARVVVADLTGGNANAMYELGMRHTTGRLTIQIGERGHLPFDVSVIRTILFIRTPDGFAAAKAALSEALRVGLSVGGDLVSAARVWTEGERARRRAVRKQKEPRRARDSEAATLSSTFSERLKKIGEAGVDADALLLRLAHLAGKLVTDLLDAINMLNHAPHYNPWDTTLSRWEDRLQEIAAAADNIVAEFTAAVNAIKPVVIFGLALASESPNDLAAAEFRASVSSVVRSVGDATARVKRYVHEPFIGREANRSFQRSNAVLVAALKKFLEQDPELHRWRQLAGA